MIPYKLTRMAKVWINDCHQKGISFGGEPYGYNEAYNDHLDRMLLLIGTPITKNGKLKLSGSGSTKLDKLLLVDELKYQLLSVKVSYDSYPKRIFKFWEKRYYNKLRQNYINFLESWKSKLSSKEYLKILKLIPPEIE